MPHFRSNAWRQVLNEAIVMETIEDTYEHLHAKLPPAGPAGRPTRRLLGWWERYHQIAHHRSPLSEYLTEEYMNAVVRLLAHPLEKIKVGGHDMRPYIAPRERRAPMMCYRICDEKDGKPMTLFHGVNGSRKIPLDEWIEASVKLVHDGSDKGWRMRRRYRSGFHSLKDKKAARRVLRETFKNLENRVIVRVRVKNTWSKEHSRHDVVLSRFLKITKEDWWRREKADA